MTNCQEHPKNSLERDKIGMPTDNAKRNKTTIKEWPPEGQKHSASQSKATRTIHKSPNRAKTKQKNTKDHEGQPEVVVRPKQSEKTEEPQEQKSHEEILSVHMDDTQKSTYTAKVGSTEVTALFNSGALLSCISKRLYDCISHTEPSKVIDTNAEPAIVVTTASDDKLINLGRCRLRIKLGEKTFEYYFQILKNLY